MNNGPQLAEISGEELAGCKTKEECQTLVEDYVQEEFAHNVTWVVDKEEA